jgi:hypothetical protein
VRGRPYIIYVCFARPPNADPQRNTPLPHPVEQNLDAGKGAADNGHPFRLAALQHDAAPLEANPYRGVEQSGSSLGS